MTRYNHRVDAQRHSLPRSPKNNDHTVWAKPNRYHEAGIPNPRAVMAFTAVALVLLAVGVLGWSVVL